MPADAAGLVAALEERFLVPACTSRHARRWVTGHRALSWPLLRDGQVARYVATTADGVVRVATVGRPKRFDPWLGRLAATPVAAPPGRVPVHRPDAPARLDADLVLVHIHRWAAAAFRGAGWHTVPSAVRWQADTADAPPARPCRSLRSDLKDLRRQGYVAEVASAPSDWDEFFDLMVAPEARARFAGRAWIPSARLRRDFAARGTVHFVRLDGIRVAGCCTLPTADGVWLPVSGVRHGDPGLFAKGAATAALAATLRWVRERGYRRVDLGRTGPFLDDGVAWFKEKWGFRPVVEPLAHLIALRARPGSVAAQALLRRHPVRVETAAGLEPLEIPDADG